MSWKKYLEERRVERRKTSKGEIDDLRVVVDRNLSDASLPGLSDVGRFTMAYNAARLVAVMAIRSSGYRIRLQSGGHYNTFLVLDAVSASAISSFAAYLDICREKRNKATYVTSEEVTSVEATELLQQARKFLRVVEAWIGKTHPELAKSP